MSVTIEDLESVVVAEETYIWVVKDSHGQSWRITAIRRDDGLWEGPINQHPFTSHRAAAAYAMLNLATSWICQRGPRRARSPLLS